MATYRVAVLLGSLRKGSFSSRIGKALASVAPPELQLETVEIGGLPFYNQDLETDTPPPAWTAFRETMRACDAVLFVTPEYNRSFPAVLKNAIDVGSRPWGKSLWANKPAAIVSQSPGALGGMGANHQLRTVVTILGMPLLPLPEVYLSQVGELVDADAQLLKAETKDFLGKVMSGFADWIGKTQAR